MADTKTQLHMSRRRLPRWDSLRLFPYTPFRIHKLLVSRADLERRMPQIATRKQDDGQDCSIADFFSNLAGRKGDDAATKRGLKYQVCSHFCCGRCGSAIGAHNCRSWAQYMMSR